MSRARRFRWTAILLTAPTVVLGVVACGSEAKRPPESGDCVPTPGAPCSPHSGGGASSEAVDSGSGANDDAPTSIGTDASPSCTLIAAANPTCQPCLDTSCGPSCMACTGQCALIVTCTQACAQGNPACATDCESRYPNGSTAYGDFANCVQ